jgi:hypothetical protein
MDNESDRLVFGVVADLCASLCDDDNDSTLRILILNL